MKFNLKNLKKKNLNFVLPASYNLKFSTVFRKKFNKIY